MNDDIRLAKNSNYIIRNYVKLKNEYNEKREAYKKLKIAILGGSTTHFVTEILELYLLNIGINPVFYESDYNKYWEDAYFSNDKLDSFHPDIIYFHINNRNISSYPNSQMSIKDIDELVSSQVNTLIELYERTIKRFNCSIITNNFEYPSYRSLGNYDSYSPYGKTHFIKALNNKLEGYVLSHDSIYLNDICYLSSICGIRKWNEQNAWCMYKSFPTLDEVPRLAHSISNIISAMYGQSKKIVALDLDNTIWGGIIGEDGIHDIKVGNGDPESELYLEFQKYLLELRDKGILLSVVSKNDESIALNALNDSNGVIKKKDLCGWKINWEPKSENIIKLGKELSLTLGGFVFIDDNPMEKDEVGSKCLDVTIPAFSNISDIIYELDDSGLFEKISLSEDDVARNTMYAQNFLRNKEVQKYDSYRDYLLSLNMSASFMTINDNNIERATQLINKSNQFNLTTKRLSIEEVREMTASESYITICGSLDDKFGKNGIVTVMLVNVQGSKASIIEWVMSCRVLKRDLEYALFDYLVSLCINRGIRLIEGEYIPTAKNSLVKDLYLDLGFSNGDDTKVWTLNINSDYKEKNKVIIVGEKNE